MIIGVALLGFLFGTVFSLLCFAKTKAVHEWLSRRDVWADDMLRLTVCASVLIGALSAGLLSAAVHAQSTAEPQDVSMLQLITNPSQYDDKLVRVIGFCRLEFEGNALYLHREDFEHSISKNSVWLQVDWPVPENLRAMSDEYVIVEATFSAEHRGHFGMFSGSLEQVTRLDRWGPRSETERLLRLQPLTR